MSETIEDIRRKQKTRRLTRKKKDVLLEYQERTLK